MNKSLVYFLVIIYKLMSYVKVTAFLNIFLRNLYVIFLGSVKSILALFLVMMLFSRYGTTIFVLLLNNADIAYSDIDCYIWFTYVLQICCVTRL